MGVATPWTKLLYGTDLVWAANTYATPVTVGNGTAYFAYQRTADGLVFWVLAGEIGTTTVLPGGGWIFEVPAILDRESTPLAPNNMPGSGVVRCAAATDAFQHVDARLQVANAATTNAEVIVMATGVDAGSGQLSKVVPGTMAAGDYFVVSGWCPGLNN